MGTLDSNHAAELLEERGAGPGVREYTHQPNEVTPQGGPVVCDTVADPEDDGSEVQGLADFMALLAAPETGARTSAVRQGQRIFRQIKYAIAVTLKRCRPGPTPRRRSATSA